MSHRFFWDLILAMSSAFTSNLYLLGLVACSCAPVPGLQSCSVQTQSASTGPEPLSDSLFGALPGRVTPLHGSLWVHTGALIVMQVSSLREWCFS